GEIAALDGFVILGVGGGMGLEAGEQLGSDDLGDDDDAGGITDDQVAGVDDDAAAADGIVDLAGTAVQGADRRGAAREDGEIELADVGEVADEAVHDEAGCAAVLGLGGDQVAEYGVERGAAGIDDDDVAGLDHIERLVDHEV